MKTQIDCSQDSPKKAKEFSPLAYRIFYGFFILLTVWFVILGDYSIACTQLGVGLVFDPFDQKQPFGERPMWQRVWLMVHLAVLLLLFGLTLANV